MKTRGLPSTPFPIRCRLFGACKTFCVTEEWEPVSAWNIMLLRTCFDTCQRYRRFSLAFRLADDITFAIITMPGPWSADGQGVQRMDTQGQISALIKEIRRQLSMSQEDLARQLGVSYATVNRWENRQSNPSKLAKAHLEAFCEKMTRRGKLTLSEDGER